jgi:hypothetical protein
MSMAQEYLINLIALNIVCGTCAMSLFLLQPVEMVQPSTLRIMYRIAQLKTSSRSFMLRIFVYQNDVKHTLIS